MHMQVRCAHAQGLEHGCWLVKSSWPEIQITESNSVYLINTNTNRSRMEGLGACRRHSVAEFNK